jgi:hypothetical protein
VRIGKVLPGAHNMESALPLKVGLPRAHDMESALPLKVGLPRETGTYLCLIMCSARADD